ncbi:MAG: hypothetical protein IPJ88_02365 [Myxococcales bacterium]|nr:MAG: hypothetical protein IPJ88_02365 [Myxococcales bacterium]
MFLFLLLASCYEPCSNSGSNVSGQTPETTQNTQALASPDNKGDEHIDAHFSFEETLQFVDTELSPRDLLKQLEAHAHDVSSFKPVGTSSIVFRVELDNDLRAAFKPSTDTRRSSYQREVAAYRLAEYLGMANVPPATLVAYDRQTLSKKLDPDYRDIWKDLEDQLIWNDNDQVKGALIYWIDEMRPAEFEEVSGSTDWQQWLSLNANIDPEVQSLAQDLGSMLVFDYLIGNWDRFSGGNFKFNPSRTRLLLLDHNSAFGVPFKDKVHDRVLKRLKMTQTFSKTQIGLLKELDQKKLSALMQIEHNKNLLLSDWQLRKVLDRRATILSYVDSLITLHGENKVFRFP